MALKKQSGNMYEFVSHTWNPITGKCPHDCSYCYVKIFYNEKFPQPPLHLNEKELKTDLGKGNFIFVGSGTDVFAKDVPAKWIEKVLAHCKKYDENKYLFQSKNPARFQEFFGKYPKDVVFGTTIETNRDCSSISKAPSTQERAKAMHNLQGIRMVKMVTIEPILKFDLEEMVELIVKSDPQWVNIGADSKNMNLPEPTKEEVDVLIKRLRQVKEIKLKGNLARLVKA